MKRILRPGLCMLLVLLALASFKLFYHPAPDSKPIRVAAPSVQPVSITLPPPTTLPLPPTSPPTTPPFTTEEELQAHLLEQLEQAGYTPAEPSGRIISFDSVPDGYVKLDGLFVKPDPGGSEGSIYLQYWYCLSPCRIVSLQQSESASSVSEQFTYENLRSYPYFLSVGWVNYRATYLTGLDDFCINAVLSSIEDVPEDELEFLIRLR